jgi:LmbE family N-acetylglucosaminyl deacetylase
MINRDFRVWSANSPLGHAARRSAWTLCVGLLLSLAALAQAPVRSDNPVDPLPQDTGAVGLKQMLVRLQTTGRLMQTTAHPDDEDGGMLTLESRGKGASVLLLTLNRGEGGQNKVGSNLFDVLGVLRTLELTASDRYYGVEQRFTRVADFGFSKSPEETFEKWKGHDIALSDMVRVIRTFRPDVLVSRFSGTSRDGHGHHEAAGILTREAFYAAANANRFPDQIKEGLLPWQAKKLYVGNVCGFMATTCPPENYTVKLNTGEVNPSLGMSYIEFAMEGLRHQLSQGAGGWSVEPGDRFTYYKLVESVLPSTIDKDGHEKDFFDGIDISLPGLASNLGEDEKKVSELRPALVQIVEQVKVASTRGEKDISEAAQPLFEVVQKLDALIPLVEKSTLSASRKVELVAQLRDKQEQAEAALNLAMNLSLQATVASPKGAEVGLEREQDALTVVSPGQDFSIAVKFRNGSTHPLKIENVSLDGPQDWVIDSSKSQPATVQPGGDFSVNFRLRVPSKVVYTHPALHRSDPERDPVYTVDEPKYETIPFPPPLFRARIIYSIGGGPPRPPSGQISSQVVVPFLDERGVEEKRPLAVAPVFSVTLEPGEQILSVANGSATTVRVGVTCNLTGTRPGTLRLEIPSGWRADPDKLQVELNQRGEHQGFEFKVFPGSLKEGKAEIRAVLTAGSETFDQGYTVVTRPDLNTFYYYQPAVQRVSIVDVKVPKNLKVGYVMGAGDDIPTVLKQIGMDVTIIPAEKIATEDLSRYGTVVLGIRAYDTQKEVAANNKKLLDYVSSGGTLIVQYNTGVSDFNGGHMTPYPAELSRARVSVEDAPVEILAPEDNAFHYPNKITDHDFDGWVQERGLYFMDQWDSNFKPLLACHDPGEQPQKGGLLKAQYGKGTYIYTGYAFFRQLPAGVPGAIRLYVNLLSAKSSGQ